MEAAEPTEADPLLGQMNRVINSSGSRSGTEEMRNPAHWSEESYDLSEQDIAFGAKPGGVLP